ncbi:MAG: neutral/alkaline non-lysosomal ceramidase N-terminal domain-containing protein [Chitinophagales bacterium]
MIYRPFPISILLAVVFIIHFSFSYAQSEDQSKPTENSAYIVGTGIKDFTRLLDGSLPHGIGTYGLVNYYHPIDTTITDTIRNIVNGVHLPLKTRVITIKHVPSNTEFVYVLLDLAFASNNIRKGVLERIWQIRPDFKSASLMLTATHTHSAPGGFTDYMGYEVATPGYKPEIVEVVAQRTYEAILEAWKNEQPMQLIFAESTVPDSIPIAFSRKALPGYNRNPEIKKPIDEEHNYLATDRLWQMIYFEKSDSLHSILNFFGAHPNRLGADIISADTRGAASTWAEKELPENGVALFAQNAPGDIDSEGYYRDKVNCHNKNIVHPAYYSVDSLCNVHRVNKSDRVQVEGKFLKEQAFRTIAEPEASFKVDGSIDCELIYIDMTNQQIPLGNYPKTLDPTDYYKNDYFLLGRWGKVGAAFSKKVRTARTSEPSIGLAAIARLSDNLTNFVVGLEKTMRYGRLGLSVFKDKDKAAYVWQMYRSQGDKSVMLEGGHYPSAVGFKIGGPIFNIFTKFDAVLYQLDEDHKNGLHFEHTMYPSIAPLQIVIIGNIAILGVSGEPGNIAGQRIEKAVLTHLEHRGVERVIMNGYANENTGYIFTPEEYTSQFYPQQCGFVIYGRWTEPAFRYNYELLAKAMLLHGEEREAVLDRSIQHPEFSKEWYNKASGMKHLEKVVKEEKKKGKKK